MKTGVCSFWGSCGLGKTLICLPAQSTPVLNHTCDKGRRRECLVWLSQLIGLLSIHRALGVILFFLSLGHLVSSH